ncbi:hypothetical protein LAZ67_11001357 [Cordylochernes scorpioides]|uniref:Tc1-like transposase DDE domain-containing protein n=1 Tax=Cordylochernes scorpioides TaxID=51811 RepID=A0ABY6KYD4_9ARAC|nr:hypothetical protein LAZ67_11001357 [Cordylochernes scorpioides]
MLNQNGSNRPKDRTDEYNIPPTITIPTPHTRTPTSLPSVVSGSINWGVVFSDDSRLLLCFVEDLKHTWRRHRLRVDPGLTFEHHTGPQQGIMIKGAISLDSRTLLVVIPGARQYEDTPALLPSRSHHSRLIFQQDNTQPHTARVIMDCLQSCQTLPWPARSPDLSPILQPSGNVEYLARHLKTIRQKKAHHPGIFTSARHIVQVEYLASTLFERSLIPGFHMGRKTKQEEKLSLVAAGPTNRFLREMQDSHAAQDVSRHVCDGRQDTVRNGTRH